MNEGKCMIRLRYVSKYVTVPQIYPIWTEGGINYLKLWFALKMGDFFDFWFNLSLNRSPFCQVTNCNPGHTLALNRTQSLSNRPEMAPSTFFMAYQCQQEYVTTKIITWALFLVWVLISVTYEIQYVQSQMTKNWDWKL